MEVSSAVYSIVGPQHLITPCVRYAYRMFVELKREALISYIDNAFTSAI